MNETSEHQYEIKHIKNFNIGILHYSEDNIKEYADKVFKTKVDYAKKWGWEIIDCRNPGFKERDYYYTGLECIRKNLPKYDWIWYLDNDAAIMNHEIDARQFIDENYDIILSKDLNGINLGSVFYRNTPFTNLLLEMMATESQFYGHPWVCQQALKTWHQNIELIRNKIKVIDKKLINSFRSYLEDFNDYEDGDFILHLPGISIPDRINVFKEML
jgi:hypothetical protein